MVEVTPRIFPEPLYLLKDGTNEVIVNNCHLLKQHQINGLRFLFAQFQKKCQGVIVNFPSNCGKTVTVVLFLQAIKNLFKKPVLILCRQEDKIDIWKEYFLKWTEFKDDDIAINSAKLLKSKRIFIKQSNDLLSYQRYSWSIVIVKDDLVNKELSLISDADYKIWITSTDVKKDLTLLGFIYKWLYPKSMLNIKDLEPSSKKHSEVLLKSIYLDSFLEDFVIREDYVKQFDTAKKSTFSYNVTNQNHENKDKKSRKNKDDTGTKIKRSRRIIEDDPTNENEVSVNEVQNDRYNDEVSINNMNNSESIIHNLELHKYLEEQTLSATDKIETKMEVDSTQQMNFNDAINDIVKNENIQTENSTESLDSNKWNENDNKHLDDEIMNCDKNNEMKDVLGDSIHIMQSEQKLDNIEEKCMDVVESRDMITDLDETKDSVKSHNNIDRKLSELEEKTMKKFKGSFLDSIF